MADFCQQCSIEVFGEDMRDLAGLNPDASITDKAGVLCEGCGWIVVDNEGKCIDPYCEVHGIAEQTEIEGLLY